MPDNNDFRAGAYSGLLALIMVVALSVMAFVALEPPELQTASLDPPLSVQTQELAIPALD